MSSRLVPVTALAALLPTLLAAQTERRDTARVAPVVVTATRTALARDRSPASVTVLTGERLRAQGITTLADALRQVPGLTVVRSGGTGAVTSLFTRGSESRHTKVLLDGIPVNEAGGAIDLSTLSTDDLDRIEIVRGPASVLYGSDAMAGVVQLFTRTGRGPARLETAARGGGFGSYDADAALGGGDGRLDFGVAGARHATDGIQLFNSGYRQNVASMHAGMRGRAGDVRATLRYTDNEFHFPTNGSGQVVDSNAVRRDGRIAAALEAGYLLLPAAELRLSLASHDVHAATDDRPDSPGDTAGYYYATGDRSRRRSGDLRLTLALPASVQLALGAQVEREWQASETQSNFGNAGFTARRRNTGLYGQLLLAPAEPYTLALGTRYDHNERFGDFLTYRAAASARLAEATRLRASVGTAFREPTFLENYGGAYVIGNPALSPEHALSADVGVEQDVGTRLVLGATYFANSFRDLIDYRFSTSEPNFFNVARTRATGAELELRATLGAGLHADAAFTYLDARVAEPGTSRRSTAVFAPGARLLRRPLHSLDAGLAYRAAAGRLELRVHRAGTREDVYYAPDFSATRVTLPSYLRADLSGEASLGGRATGLPALTATVRVENVLDARYTEAAGFNFDFARTDAAALGQTGYRAMPRRVLVGLRVLLPVER